MECGTEDGNNISEELALHCTNVGWEHGGWGWGGSMHEGWSRVDTSSPAIYVVSIVSGVLLYILLHAYYTIVCVSVHFIWVYQFT